MEIAPEKVGAGEELNETGGAIAEEECGVDELGAGGGGGEGGGAGGRDGDCDGGDGGC